MTVESRPDGLEPDDYRLRLTVAICNDVYTREFPILTWSRP